MSKAKDFQMATAERILEIFRSGQKRVLLSDEVGLGKTIMARTVIEMSKTLPGVELFTPCRESALVITAYASWVAGTLLLILSLLSLASFLGALGL